MRRWSLIAAVLLLAACSRGPVFETPPSTALLNSAPANCYFQVAGLKSHYAGDNGEYFITFHNLKGELVILLRWSEKDELLAAAVKDPASGEVRWFKTIDELKEAYPAPCEILTKQTV
jgi:hypothetical protein